MKVTVVWATRLVQDVVSIEVPDGATVFDAISRSGLVAHYGLDSIRMTVAIYGRRAPLHAPLADGDRIEITRPLAVDPKEARRMRAGAKPLSPRPPKSKRRRTR